MNRTAVLMAALNSNLVAEYRKAYGVEKVPLPQGWMLEFADGGELPEGLKGFDGFVKMKVFEYLINYE